MNPVATAKKYTDQYVDKRIVASTAIGVGVFGAAVFLMTKTGIKAMKDAAKVIKGGK